MNEFYKRMNVRNDSKRKVAYEILDHYNTRDTLVIDVGAGSCVIDQMLIDGKFNGDIIAIDKNREAPHMNFEGMLFLKADAVRGVIQAFQFQRYDRVVFVLSAVLHEMSYEDRTDLFHLIRLYKRFAEVVVIIREPIFSLDLASWEGIPSREDSADFEEYHKLHEIAGLSEQHLFINYCFAKSYGSDAWEREKHEGRFFFSLDDILGLAKIAGCHMESISYDHDEFYKETLPYGLYDKLAYTGNIIILKGD